MLSRKKGSKVSGSSGEKSAVVKGVGQTLKQVLYLWLVREVKPHDHLRIGECSV